MANKTSISDRDRKMGEKPSAAICRFIYFPRKTRFRESEKEVVRPERGCYFPVMSYTCYGNNVTSILFFYTNCIYSICGRGGGGFRLLIGVQYFKECAPIYLIHKLLWTTSSSLLG